MQRPGRRASSANACWGRIACPRASCSAGTAVSRMPMKPAISKNGSWASGSSADPLITSVRNSQLALNSQPTSQISNRVEKWRRKACQLV